MILNVEYDADNVEYEYENVEYEYDGDSQWTFSDPTSLPGALHWKCDGYKLPGDIMRRNLKFKILSK